MIETNEKKTVFVTPDYDEWRNVLKDMAQRVLPDKLVFPEDLRYISGVQYMTNPVACHNGKMLTVCEHRLGNIPDLLSYIKKMTDEFTMYVYRIQWRYVQVDGYTIDDIILYFATGDR